MIESVPLAVRGTIRCALLRQWCGAKLAGVDCDQPSAVPAREQFRSRVLGIEFARQKIMQGPTITVEELGFPVRAYALKSTFYHMLWFDNFAIR